MTATIDPKAQAAGKSTHSSSVAPSARSGSAQDTPGRPKPESSRQQTHTDQELQSGSPTVDSRKERGKSG